MVTNFDLDGDTYHDNRMFVLHLCRCIDQDLPDELVQTTIYHEESPPNHKWCVATYRNTQGYPMFRVDRFETKTEARAYIEYIEPRTPLVSLGGRSPNSPLSYEQFTAWKLRDGLKEYDYAKVYLPGGSKPRETVISRKR